MDKVHIVHERMVVTYQPDGWPVGCLTGYVNRHNGFVLEHVISFAPRPRSLSDRALDDMMRACMEEAWLRHFPYIQFHLPPDHPRHARLSALAERCGFTQYEPNYWVCRKP